MRLIAALADSIRAELSRTTDAVYHLVKLLTYLSGKPSSQVYFAFHAHLYPKNETQRGRVYIPSLKDLPELFEGIRGMFHRETTNPIKRLIHVAD